MQIVPPGPPEPPVDGLEERADCTPFGASDVIDLAAVRIAYGVPNFRAKICEHKSLLYSPRDRRVWCKDCERDIDGFDAFMIYTRHFHQMAAQAAGAVREAEKVRASVLIRKASKDIDLTWGRGMAPKCPHCKSALLADDFADGFSCMPSEIERARRARKPGGQPSG